MGAEFRQVKFPFLQLPNNQGNFSYSSNETAFPSDKSSSLGPTVGPIRATDSLQPCSVR